MGNEGSNLKDYPAAYNHVIAVGATNRDGSKAAFSNYGSWRDISAPGVDIWSTMGTGTGIMSGTSQATPIVSGVAALYMSVYGNPGPAAMRKILKSATSNGIIDAAKIFKKMKNPPGYTLRTVNGSSTVDGSVPKDGHIRLESGSGFTSNATRFLYTTDGSDPLVLDGEAVNGQDVCELGRYDEEQGCYILPMDSFAVGDTVCFKFMEVEAGAIPSEIAEAEVRITAPEPVIENVRIGISGAGKLRLGQSTVLTAEVYGESATEGVEVQHVAMPDQTVVWSVVEPAGDDRVSVDENGTVTVSSDFDGQQIVIRAQSTVYVDENGDPVSTTYILDVSALLQVGSICLAGEVPTLYTGEIWNPELLIIDVEGTPMSLDEAGLVWTSSNEKVAKVMQVRNEETGVYEVAVYAAQEGNVKLTGTASDGSGKGVTFMATVKPSVSSITISGQSVIQPGATATYKAAILPKNAGNKTLTWYLTSVSSNMYGNVTINAATGKVTVSPSAPIGGTFSVWARTATGTTVTSNAIPVTVDRKGTGVRVNSASTVTVYAVNLPETSTKIENRISVSATRLGGSYSTKGIVWTGGNPKIATFTDNGSGTITITAIKAGKVTFTAKANDGSGKSAKVTVKVITPASSLHIVAKTKDETKYIGYGKSAKNKAVLGNSYGKPSISKVTWDFNVYTRSGSNYNINYSLTNTVKTNKLITINKSGTLTIKAGAESWVSGYYIGVTATATDGTGYSDTVYYYPIALTNRIRVYSQGYVGYSNHEWSRKNVIYLVEKGYYYTLDIDGKTKTGAKSLSDYSVKSSNPSKVGAEYKYVSGQNGGDKLVIYVDDAAKLGSVTVKVTACDGSNKSCTLKLKVINPQ